MAQDIPRCCGPGLRCIIRTRRGGLDSLLSNMNWNFCHSGHGCYSKATTSHLYSKRLLPTRGTWNTLSWSGCRSAEVDGCVLWPPRLDDFWLGSLHSLHLLLLLLILLVALTHVDHHAGGGVCRRVQLVLLSCGKQTSMVSGDRLVPGRTPGFAWPLSACLLMGRETWPGPVCSCASLMDGLFTELLSVKH